MSLAIFAIIFALSFFIIKPYLVSVIAAAVLAYLFHPLYVKINYKTKKDWASALIICAIIILAVIIPSILIIKSLAGQAVTAYNSAAEYLANNPQNIEAAQNMKDALGVDMGIDKLMLQVANFFTSTSKNFLASMPNKILNFFIMIIFLYYLLKDGDLIAQRIENFVPLKRNLKSKMLDDIKKVTSAVIRGSLLTALVQGVIGGIGFAIFGIHSPIFWGFIMAIFALIPMFGTAIIWLPAALILLGKGIISGQGILIGKGIGLLIYGTLLISLIDNFLKPKLIGNETQMHPAIILVGILGGINLFGIIGIILGPLTLALFVTLIKIYGEEHGI